MAVQFIGSVFSTSATAGTLPEHQAGDLLIGIAYRNSATVPGMPSGWTAVQQATTTNTSIRVASFTATGPGTSGDTWTNAGKVLVLVYRQAAIGASTTAIRTSSASTSWTSPALTLSDTSGGSWVLTAAAFNSLNRVGTLPPGLTAIPGMDGTVPAGHTGAGVTSYAGGTGTISLSSFWAAVSVELVSTSSDYPLTGTAAASSATSGAVTARRALAGVLAALTATTGTIATTRALTGTTPVVSGTTGAATVIPAGVTHPATGTTPVISGTTGAASRTAPLSGTTTVTSGTSGDLDATTRALTGTIPAVSGTTGALTGHPTLAGTTAVVSGTTGNLGDAYSYTPPPRPIREVAAGSHRAHVRLTGLTGPATGLDLPITGGTLTLDLLADVRAHLSATIAAIPDMDPIDATRALDVRSRSEYALSLGVEDDLGVTHWTQVAIVRPSNPRMTLDGDGVQITCDLDDRGYAVKLGSIDRSWTIPTGTGLLAEVRDMLAYVAPDLPVDLPLAGDMTAGSDVPLAAEPGVDVWQEARRIVSTMGRILHVDADGVVRAPMVTDPLAADPVTVPVTGWQDASDTKDIANAWGVQWMEPRPDDAPTGWVAESGWEWALDEASIAQVGKRVRTFKDSSIGTPDHARLVARTMRVNSHDLTHAASCRAAAHPDLALEAALLDPIRGDRYRVTALQVDLATGDTDVQLGAAPASMARLLAAAFQPIPIERDEVVVAVDPLASRPVAEPEGAVTLVEWTSAVKGVEVNDVIIVRCHGSSRVAVGSRTVKPIAVRDAGETVASIKVGTGAAVPIKAGQTTTISGGASTTHTHRTIGSFGLKPSPSFNYITFTDLPTATNAANQILEYLRDFDSWLRSATTQTGTPSD